MTENGREAMKVLTKNLVVPISSVMVACSITAGGVVWAYEQRTDVTTILHAQETRIVKVEERIASLEDAYLMTAGELRAMRSMLHAQSESLADIRARLGVLQEQRRSSSSGP